MPLTEEEHTLLLAMFAKQQQHINIILEVLRSRGILSGDDAAAFRFAVAKDEPSNVALLRAVRDTYVDFAKKLGIQLPPDLKNLG